MVAGQLKILFFLLGGDSNLYGYVGNDPVNFVDPEGLWIAPAIAIGGAVVIAYNIGVFVKDVLEAQESMDKAYSDICEYDGEQNPDELNQNLKEGFRDVGQAVESGTKLPHVPSGGNLR